MQLPLPSVSFLGRPKTKMAVPKWLLETFSASPRKLLSGIQWNLKWSNILTSFTKSLRLIWKLRWPPRHMISWVILDFTFETAKQNSTKLNWKQSWHIVLRCTICGPFGPFFLVVAKPVKAKRHLIGIHVSLQYHWFVLLFFRPDPPSSGSIAHGG